MNTKDIEKREELCRLLNMDFDEAGELFSDETMKSMQMTQVNGGAVAPWIQKLGELIVSGAASEAISEVYNDVKEWLFGKPTAAGGVVKFKDENGNETTILLAPNGEIQVHELRDSTGMYYRNIIITSTKK